MDAENEIIEVNTSDSESSPCTDHKDNSWDYNLNEWHPAHSAKHSGTT